MSRTIAVLTIAVALTAPFVVPPVASAEEGGHPLILPEPTEASPLKFSSSSGQVRFENTGSVIMECASGSGSGKFTSKRAGTITLTFKGCAWFSLKCQNKGGEAGVISFTNVPVHLVSSSEVLGLAISLPSPLPIECWLGAEFRGTLIGSMTGVLKETTETTLSFEQSKGIQSYDKCQLAKEFCYEGELQKTLQLEAKNGSEWTDIGVARRDKVTFEHEVTFVP